MAERARIALDQNFPLPILRQLNDFMPDFELVPLRDIDERLAELSDRQLLIALRQLGWDKLVTNNYKMLKNPRELAAILKTQVTVYAVEGVGDDPLRATGAILLDLPGALGKTEPNKAQVFWMRPRSPTPVDPWDLLATTAKHQQRGASEMYEEVKVTDDELSTPVLD
jgi:hypothetical protein